MNALEVRDNIVEHLRTHPNTIDGTPLDQFVCTQQSWEDYLSTMEAPGTWGDHLVLLGAAEFLQADTEVITTASETHPVTIKAVNRQDKTKELFLGHISEFHYVSLNELGQICRDCHLELSVCQCVDNINGETLLMVLCINVPLQPLQCKRTVVVTVHRDTCMWYNVLNH
ncbi:OTU domain-containing protein DDB_G0284757-like [Haliotis rubra]|uniref:OTU domain-containing protein DDB_G0284757-like n=1 Tax=Haliotis rubra TaxID=36100 RepID=UPI001EE5C7ED|nr:OTU domain-containing protein DDB_G0284757-like [Haliotis rubra]